MPGSPTGALYTWSPDVLQAFGAIIDFFQVPHFIQMALAKLLEDKGKTMGHICYFIG